LANGDKGFPKERVEVFVGGKILQLDNFRKLRGWGWKGFSSMNLWRQDKGQTNCVMRFMRAVTSASPPLIPSAEIFDVCQTAIELAEQIRS